MAKALALISGGLDSILAAKLIKDQGIDVTGICFKSAFFGPENAIRMAEAIDIPLVVVDFTDEHIAMTKNPKYGYGKNMNPCIDCHSLMLRNAGKLMEDMGADFLVTGEVLNQRPMSQTLQSLHIVKRESGFGEKILRPLCAKNLTPTEMEKEGMVDREKLLDISGKSRKVQMALAKILGIKDYPSPAGGCMLTEPGYARRLKDLYEYNKDFDLMDIEMLKIGRHFRVSPKVKIVSTRDAREYFIMLPLIKDDYLIFEADGVIGSLIVLLGDPTKDEINLAAAIAGRYSKGNNQEILKVGYRRSSDDTKQFILAKPAKDQEIEGFML